MRIAFLFVLSIATAGCNLSLSDISDVMTNGSPGSVSDAENALRGHGFREIQITGLADTWSCGKDDNVFGSHKFQAKNPIGDQVHGTVCCGYYKGCTVRF